MIPDSGCERKNLTIIQIIIFNLGWLCITGKKQQKYNE